MNINRTVFINIIQSFDTTLTFKSDHSIHNIDVIPITIDRGYGSDFYHFTDYIYVSKTPEMDLLLELESDIELLCLLYIISCFINV